MSAKVAGSNPVFRSNEKGPALPRNHTDQGALFLPSKSKRLARGRNWPENFYLVDRTACFSGG